MAAEGKYNFAGFYKVTQKILGQIALLQDNRTAHTIPR